MAAAPPGDLGDFFNKKKKKAIKGTNLNVASTAAKPEVKKKNAKDAEEEGWEEEQVVAATMKVETVGKLVREEEQKEDETSAPAWGRAPKDSGKRVEITDRKYPTLAAGVKALGQNSTNINIDDGRDNRVNIATSKNAFSALHGGEDSDDDGPKRPKEIKPAMVTKKKGEFTKDALAREVEKHCGKKEKKSKDKRDDDETDSESDEEDAEAEKEAEAEARAERAAQSAAKKSKKRRDDEAAEKAKEAEPAVVEEQEEDVKIVADLVASKAKYETRKRMPRVDLPRSELKEQKENKPAASNKGGKKKFASMDEEEEMGSKKLQYADW